MQNKNLVPKIITDKNGVTTTRWVKPDTGTKGKAPIPQVTAAKRVSSADLQVELWEIFDKCDPHSLNVQRVKETLPKLSHETLDTIASNVRGYDDMRDLAALWIDLYGNKDIYLRELFCYREAFDPSTDYSFVEEAVHYLHNYEELSHIEDCSKVDEDLKQKIYDVLGVTETAIAEDYEAEREGNDPILPADLRKLVMDRPDDLDRINEILLDNPGVRSGAQIAMMLDSTAPSIANGIL